jgi:hypothetical protein
MDITLARELIDDGVRPGQPGGSLAVHRLPAGQMLMRGKPVGCNRYDWTQEEDFRFGLYGRGSYGQVRYLSPGQ